jgi:hypothetical protein
MHRQEINRTAMLKALADAGCFVQMSAILVPFKNKGDI